MNDLREQFAALAHEQWSGWMNHMFQKSIEGDDGSVVIPAPLVARWKRQMNTSYADLPLDEQESDRAEAEKMLKVAQSYWSHQDVQSDRTIDTSKKEEGASPIGD